MTVPAGKPSLNTILDSCAASTENNDMWDDSKTIPSLGKGTTRLKHREKKYRKSAIFYGAMNSVIDASLFVNVTMKAFFADVVIFAIVWLGPKTACYDYQRCFTMKNSELTCHTMCIILHSIVESESEKG